MADDANRSRSAKTRKPPAQKTVPRAASAQPKKTTQDDLLAMEENYKRLNNELEAKTAVLVQQAEAVMREQQELLSKPVPTYLSFSAYSDIGDNENDQTALSLIHLWARKAIKSKAESKMTKLQRPVSATKGRKPIKARARTLESKNAADDVAVPEDFTNFSLAKTINKIEGTLGDDLLPAEADDDIMPSAANEMGADPEAQIRFLKAKLRVMQEELDRLSHLCGKKDDELSATSARLKEAEEERARLQRSSQIHQAHADKYRALSDEQAHRADALDAQLSSINKELEALKRTQKQASSAQGAAEVRLNRALEEAERHKAELTRLQQASKDSGEQARTRIEQLSAESKRLEKQKIELIAGYKKQMKLIDILKRQKMHIEAAKLLSFTEEEFMKALDWRS
uniref:Testis expressed 9 n=1 Tax=Petromyzon marinus TaxID=7757 RepID=S4RJU4_PETMA